MMIRERLEALAGDERFIPGIYNYCDRWCERTHASELRASFTCVS